MTNAQIEARRKGGYALQAKYSEEVKRGWRALGGRSKLKSYAEILELENKKEGGKVS